MTEERTTMNGKPVYRVAVKTVLNLHSGFEHKLLCDGPTLALGEGCAYSCAFCYVPAIYQKLDRVRELLEREGKKHEDVVMLREDALNVLRSQLRHPGGKPKYRDDENDRRVLYASPADDVAANMDLVRATVEACAEILSATNWHIRLLSKSNLLPKVADLLIERSKSVDMWTAFDEKDVRERMIFGFSTGTFDDDIARAFEEGTPKVSKRIAALHDLQDRGFRTFGMVCPSLPAAGMLGYVEFAEKARELLRYDKLEHVYAEVINLRGASFNRTIAALRAAGLDGEADRVEHVSSDAAAWDDYNRTTFYVHAAACEAWVGKLRYLTYTKPNELEFWKSQVKNGAVLL